MKLILVILGLLTNIAYGQTDRRVLNRAQDGDLCLQVNDGGVATDALCVDGPTHYVGIGTAAPSTWLTVRSNLGIPSGLTGTELIDKSITRFHYGTGTQALYLFSFGTETTGLQSAANTGTAATDINLNPFGGSVNIGASGSSPHVISGLATIISTGDNSHTIQTASSTLFSPLTVNNTGATSSLIRFRTSGTTRGYIGSTSVLSFRVGNSSDSGKFEINDSTGVAAFLGGGSATNPNIQVGSTGSVGIFSPGTNIIAFGHAAAEKMRLHDNGNIGIGTTAPTLGKLHVSEADGTAGYFRSALTSSNGGTLYSTNVDTSTGSDDNPGLYIIKGSTTNTSSQRFIFFSINADATASGYIGANGASTAAFFTASDRRLKENIESLPSGLETIGKLRPVTFRWKKEQEDAVGFVAQEVAEVIPAAVDKTDSGKGELKGEPWHMTDAKFMPYIVRAIQELNAKIDKLERENEKLRRRP